MSQIDYNKLINDAMISVVKSALKKVEKEGLPGEHHFYITFRTTNQAVSIPLYLKEKYPYEMTIVLENKFKDLSVEADHFLVTLSFNQIPTVIKVPFNAISVFSDPSVNFTLQLLTIDDLEDEEDFLIEESYDKDFNSDKSKVIDFNKFKKKKIFENET